MAGGCWWTAGLLVLAACVETDFGSPPRGAGCRRVSDRDRCSRHFKVILGFRHPGCLVAPLSTSCSYGSTSDSGEPGMLLLQQRIPREEAAIPFQPGQEEVASLHYWRAGGGKNIPGQNKTWQLLWAVQS
ncbi:hypothetical protein EYF80_005787 [Liparis tanakae]|uniref:Uncharacterized protein n=1 Tax=Liparis tanakae TaxID=230148 RepID=A0A4Z2J172_9TELE|nr:hypothetical protein EYF80_005787 [Liparis tanakae]